MTAPVIPEAEPHVRALKARLVAGLPASVKVGVGQAPAGVPPLVVLYPDPGDVHSARLVGRWERITLFVTVHAIGTGPEQAWWAMDRARAVILAAPPVVAARHVHRPTQMPGSPPITRDDDVSPPLFLAVAEFELRSDPA